VALDLAAQVEDHADKPRPIGVPQRYRVELADEVIDDL
jgi:hypothetical protein